MMSSIFIDEDRQTQGGKPREPFEWPRMARHMTAMDDLLLGARVADVAS
jgi:hypothetical protein